MELIANFSHRSKLLGASAVLALLGAASSAWAVAMPTIQALFSDPAYRSLKISPDGRYFAVIVPVDGRGELAVIRSDKSAITARYSFRDRNEEVWHYDWLKNDRLLIKPARSLGWTEVPVWHGDLFMATADKRSIKAVFGYRTGEKSTWGWGELVSDIPGHPTDILIASQSWTGRRDLQFPSLLRLNLANASSQKVMRAPRGNARFIASPAGEVRLATATDSQEVGYIYAYSPANDTWSEINRSHARSVAIEPLGLSANGRIAYLLEDPGTEPTGLYAVDLESGERRLLYRNAEENISNVVMDPHSGEPLWAEHSTSPAIKVLNPSHPLVEIHALFQAHFADARVELTSVTRDRSQAIFFVHSDRDPGAWYSVNVASRQVQRELQLNPLLNPAQMVATRPVRLAARDGLPLHGFYTALPREDGKPPPMVLLVHGGPHSQDTGAFDPEVQMLATRGYAVLQVNFRGSTGYGTAFEMAGRGQWGRAMQDDLSDATRWAVDEGLADAQRICIMGGSYGGYASLMGVVREPALYRCAIDLFGPSDLEAQMHLGDIPKLFHGKAYLEDSLGMDPAELRARSPAWLAENIEAPVLIIAGGKDERVPIEHSYRMEKALKRAGKTVETLYFKGEGHGFYKLEHRVTAYSKVMDFLQRHIGPGA
jgi:dipeptidyl aminopeptidase/acylaminoacyl peptidase